MPGIAGAEEVDVDVDVDDGDDDDVGIDVEAEAEALFVAVKTHLVCWFHWDYELDMVEEQNPKNPGYSMGLLDIPLLFCMVLTKHQQQQQIRLYKM